MGVASPRKPIIKPLIPQPADLVKAWSPIVRKMEPFVELDFSFKDQAITITDMRYPSALRTGPLYTRAELDARAHESPGDLEMRVQRFMGR